MLKSNGIVGNEKILNKTKIVNIKAKSKVMTSKKKKSLVKKTKIKNKHIV